MATETQPKPKTPPIAALAVALPGTTDSAAQIFPAGEFSVPRGSLLGEGPWRLDAESAAALIARIGDLTNPVLVDYEHHSLFTTQGVQAKAAGWMPRDGFEWREGEGLFHRTPQWTPAAATAIRDGEYRYLSAVFTYDSATGYPTDILHIALTNDPAIDGMRPLAAAASARLASHTAATSKENPMDELLEQLRWLLGLPLSAGKPEVLTELQKLMDKIKGDGEVAATARGSLLLYIAALKTQVAEQAATVAALKTQATVPDPARFAPIALVSELQGEIAALKAQNTAREVSGILEAALSAGKIATPAKRTYAYSLAGLDADGKPQAGAVPNVSALRAYLQSEEPIAALSGTQTQGITPEGVAKPGQLTTAELAVCKNLGLSPDDYAKTKQQNMAALGGAQ
jgi:phage I-like protein